MRRKGKSFSSILIASHLIVATVALAIAGIWLDRILEARAMTQLQQRAEAEARVLASQLTADPEETQRLVREMAAASGTRFTVIDSEGVVLADSEFAAAAMANHASRPEVRQALKGKTGVAERFSETVREPFLYVATPMNQGVVVRAAVRSSEVEAQRREIRRTLGITLVAMAFIAIGLSVIVARRTAAPIRRLSMSVEGAMRNITIPELHSGSREVRALSDAVSAMSRQLADRMRTIEDEKEIRETILNSVPVGIALCDRRGRVGYLNPAAKELLGEVDSLNPSRFLDGRREMSIHHPIARQVTIEPVEVDDQRMLVVIQDVTMQRRLDTIRRDFVAHASHELKTPVGAILAVAETVADAARDDPGSIERFAPRLVADARRLTNLIEDLLDLARLEEGSYVADAVDASEVVRQVAAKMESSFKDKGLAFSFESEGSIRVAVPRKDVEAVSTNLFENALRYTEHGHVRVTLRRVNGQAELRVEDSGIGIPAKDLPRVFERFYRVDTARSRSTGGTGLGLAIVRNAVERAGGSVEVTSDLHLGSTFIARLPLEAVEGDEGG